jgi:branched-chain amino acid transport system permease protein
MQVFLSQLMLGLVNGSFYAMLSLGLAVIFGLLGIVNFAHGALYMLGAYAAYIGLERFGINYWVALVVAPIVIGALGVVIERLFLRHLYKIDPIYGLLLTFGLALIAEGVLRYSFGVSGRRTRSPSSSAARPTSASWCCPTTAPGSSSPRSSSASAPGS